MNFNISELLWINKPNKFTISEERIEIKTDPNTDFWQRTYYGFQNDNAHVLYATTEEKYFSFTVKTQFNSGNLFDQCGVAIYQDSENWVKSGIEFHDNNTSWLGSVVTNNGFSDWATTDIGSDVSHMWYRLSRRESDYCIENSVNGVDFKQMRIFHLFKGDSEIKFGLVACSPGSNSFNAVFSNMEITECKWMEHKE